MKRFNLTIHELVSVREIIPTAQMYLECNDDVDTHVLAILRNLETAKLILDTEAKSTFKQSFLPNVNYGLQLNAEDLRIFSRVFTYPQEDATLKLLYDDLATKATVYLKLSQETLALDTTDTLHTFITGYISPEINNLNLNAQALNSVGVKYYSLADAPFALDTQDLTPRLRFNVRDLPVNNMELMCKDANAVIVRWRKLEDMDELLLSNFDLMTLTETDMIKISE